MNDLEPRYRCGACGRQSPTREPSEGSDHGWDESCMMGAVYVRPRTDADTDMPAAIRWIALPEPEQNEHA